MLTVTLRSASLPQPASIAVLAAICLCSAPSSFASISAPASSVTAHTASNTPSPSAPAPAPPASTSPATDDPSRSATAKRRWIRLGDDDALRVSLESGRMLILSVRAGPHDTFDSIAARFLDPRNPRALLQRANPGRAEIHAGAWCRIPATLLSQAWLERVIRTAFPQDGPGPDGWVHRPGASPLDTYGEGSWEVASWFTGDGKNFTSIVRANGLSDPVVPSGRDITVPGALLAEPFRKNWNQWLALAKEADRGVSKSAKSTAPPAGSKTPGSDDSESERTGPDTEARAGGGSSAESAESSPTRDLTYSKDDQGEFASYKLKRGEALYSAVVVRFTGRIDPDEVATAAATIAQRSGIREIGNIPVGYDVKIPRSMLLPEFLPAEDQRRKAADRARKETAKVKNPVRSRNLQGIHVILDAGHGGIDPGALIAGVAEHEYAYDVLCRVKRILETETTAVVHPIIEDPKTRFEPQSAKLLPIGGQETILTSPAHVNGAPDETTLGVNLRWYLANAIQRRLEATGVNRSRIVFASFHADVLLASLRGAMVYVPGEQYRRGTYTCRNRECSRYGEVREAPSVSFNRADRLSSEGLSREFASDLITAFKNRGIRIHPYQPVRDRVIRGGSAWLPAVLRGNGVPVKVLVEISNLNNPDDRALMQSVPFRESVARAFTDALLRYYKSSPLPPPGRTRVASRRPS